MRIKSGMRNIVLITFDSLRADHCGFMGYMRETTPTLDKIAKDGLYFENAIISGTGTSTSMFGVFTGEYAPNSFDYGINVHHREKEVSEEVSSVALCGDSKITKYWKKEFSSRKTLAQVLSKKGYNTAAFHANPVVSRYFGFNEGFKTYQDFLFENNKRKNSIYTKIVIPLVMKLGADTLYRGFSDFTKGEGVFKCWENLYIPIANWIEKLTEPFFIWILLMDTHSPYKPSRRFRKWSNSLDVYKLNWKLYRGGFTHPTFTDRERKGIINAYDDAIRYADRFVKNLWNDLKEYDPIFILHGDHGDAFGEHGFYGHPLFLYEELIHVPLIIYNGDQKGRIEKPVSLLMLSPTILDLIGEENEFPYDSCLRGGKDLVISRISPEIFNDKVRIAIRSKEWKYIEGQMIAKGELYNLKEDSHEQENVFGEHQKLVEEMSKIVKSHIKPEMEMRGIRENVSKIKKRNTIRK